jgi:signal transduction histidine kinase
VTPGRVFAPLVRRSTYLRGVHLLLGAIVLLPYVLLGIAFAQLLTNPDVPRAASLVLLAVALTIAAVPPFLAGTRALEIVAARKLLDVNLPDPVEGAPLDRESRLRGALWFAVHLAVGGAVALGLIIAVPMALALLTQPLGFGTDVLGDLRVGPLDSSDTAWLTLLGVALLLAVGYAGAGLGALAAVMAPTLLGPSPRERIAALETATGLLTERTRLARELHDSVGHALTVVTVQAAAARRVIDDDPEFARRALGAIEDSGRTAMADLDHVLGLLRDDAHARQAPTRTLTDLPALVAETRAAGVDIDAQVDGPVEIIPAAVSQEGYRVVQEAVTNAVRHAAGASVLVSVHAHDDLLDIEVTNDLRTRPDAPTGGRGLAGMRERVDVLGGRLLAAPEGRRWRVRARLPTGVRRVRGNP